MGHEYHEAQRELQDRFDTRRLADSLDAVSSDRINDAHRNFIESRDMFFIATADDHGAPQCSYKGGDPGFVRVVDERTIAFPVYDGNGMFLSAGNISLNPQVGLLFIDFDRGTRLRFNGAATIDHDDALNESYPGSQFVVRVRGKAVFANCSRYVHRYELVQRSQFVPSGSTDPPVPDWKLDPRLEGALPANDPALDPDAPTAPATPRF